MVKQPSLRSSLKHLLEQLKANPNAPSLLRLIGQKYLEKKNHQKALVYFVQAEAVDPSEDGTLHFQMANCYEALQDVTHATQHYICTFSLAFAKRLHELKRAVLTVPFSYEVRGQIHQYIKTLHFLDVLQDPSRLKTLLRLSPEEAEDHLMFLRMVSVYLRFGYDHIDFWLYHAAIARDFEDYAALVQSYHKLMEFEPENYEWLTGLSYAYYEAGDAAQALAYAQQATERYADEPECWHMLGDLYLFDDQDYDAYLAYKKASELDPQNEQCLLDVAETTPDLAEKKAFLQRLLKINPDNVEALYSLGEYHSEMQEFQQALKYYKKAHKLDELEPLYVMALADCYEELHEMDKALRYHLLILKTYDPTDPHTLLKVALIYLEKNQANKAVPMLTKLVEQDPEQVLYVTLLAQAYLRLSRFKDAERVLAPLVQHESSDFVPYLLLAYLYSQQPQLSADFAFFYEKAVSKMTAEDKIMLNLPTLKTQKAPSQLAIDLSHLDLNKLYGTYLNAAHQDVSTSYSEIAEEFHHFFQPSKNKKIH